MDGQQIAISTGLSVSYVEAGDPRGQPVLMLHGYTDTRRSFADTMAHLARLRPDLRLIALDLRGHGRSSLPAADADRDRPERGFSLVAFAADVMAFMDAKAIPSAHLVGHSLGSFIAQEIALSHPERVAQVVLIGSSAKVAGNPAISELVLAQLLEDEWRKLVEARGLAFPRDAYGLTPRDLDPNAEAWLLANWVTEPLAPRDLLARIAVETASMPLGSWLGVARAVLEMDNSERLKDLTRPTLVLWSTQDAVCPARPDQELLLATLETASRRTGVHYSSERFGDKPLPPSGMTEDDLGHNFLWAIPDQVARAIADFLERRAEVERGASAPVFLRQGLR